MIKTVYAGLMALSLLGLAKAEEHKDGDKRWEIWRVPHREHQTEHRHIPMVPEPAPGWVLVPVMIGAMLFWHWRSSRYLRS